MPLRLTVSAVVVALVLLAPPTAAFHFYVESGKKACFVHFPKEAMTLHAAYAAQLLAPTSNSEQMPANGLKIHLVAVDTGGAVTEELHLDYSDEPTSLAVAIKDDKVTLCFAPAADTPKGARARIELDVDPAAPDEHHRSEGPEAGLQYMRSVKHLYPLVDAFKLEQETAMDRLGEFDGTAESTHRRVIFWTVVNGAVAVGACLWQVWSLKRFFKDKKIV